MRHQDTLLLLDKFALDRNVEDALDVLTSTLFTGQQSVYKTLHIAYCKPHTAHCVKQVNALLCVIRFVLHV